jgi:hypothetical protein
MPALLPLSLLPWPQLLFLVKRFHEDNVFVCEEWCEVAPGNLPVWLMVKNYLLQYILLEATYLRSTCCIMGKRRGRRGAGAALVAVGALHWGQRMS